MGIDQAVEGARSLPLQEVSIPVRFWSCVEAALRFRNERVKMKQKIREASLASKECCFQSYRMRKGYLYFPFAFDTCQ